jgi:hypothetical protein
MFDEYDFNMNFHFFGDDDMSSEERARLEQELRARIEMSRNHPLALKAREIHTIVDALIESIEPEEEEEESDPDMQYLAEGEEYEDYTDEEMERISDDDDDLETRKRRRC